MSVLSEQPSNLNLLNNSAYKVSFKRIPAFTYFVQSIITPDVSLGIINVPTSFIDYKVAGEKLAYADILINIVIDEELTAFRQIHDWMLALGFPETHQQFQNLNGDLTSDMSIIILTNNSNPSYEMVFHHAFPINLAPMDLTSIDSDSTPIILPVTFAFTGPFKINKIT